MAFVTRKHKMLNNFQPSATNPGQPATIIVANAHAQNAKTLFCSSFTLSRKIALQTGLLQMAKVRLFTAIRNFCYKIWWAHPQNQGLLQG